MKVVDPVLGGRTNPRSMYQDLRSMLGINFSNFELSVFLRVCFRGLQKIIQCMVLNCFEYNISIPDTDHASQKAEFRECNCS